MPKAKLLYIDICIPPVNGRGKEDIIDSYNIFKFNKTNFRSKWKTKQTIKSKAMNTVIDYRRGIQMLLFALYFFFSAQAYNSYKLLIFHLMKDGIRHRTAEYHIYYGRRSYAQEQFQLYLLSSY